MADVSHLAIAALGRDARFNDWFGPIGIFALFYATFVAERRQNLSP